MQTTTAKTFTRQFKEWRKAADSGEVIKIVSGGRSYLFYAEQQQASLLGSMEGAAEILGSLELDEKWEAAE